MRRYRAVFTSLQPLRAWRNVALHSLAVVSAILLDVLVFSTLPTSQPHAAAAVVLGWAAVEAGLLIVRQRAPVLVFAALLAHYLLALLLITGDRPTAGLIVAAYTVSAHRRARVSVPAAVALFAVMATATTIIDVKRVAAENKPVDGLVLVIFGLYGLLAVAAWGVGRWARISRRQAEYLRRIGTLEARAAVVDVRAQIARELHDIVSSAVAAMVVHAGAARNWLAVEPTRSEAMLIDVERIGRSANADLRRMLHALRTDIDDSETPENGRSPGLLDGLDALIETVRGTGVLLTYHVDGQPQPLADSIDAAAYRILQEALTNVVKHGGAAASAQVTLTWSDTTLAIAVVNSLPAHDLPSTNPLSSGYGLIGSRERALMAGGTFAAGQEPTGQFRVVASLPVTDAVTSTAQRRPVDADANSRDGPRPDVAAPAT